MNRGGFVKIRVGLEDHLLAGRLGALELAVYVILLLQVDYRTGIWTGSAPRIKATAPRGASLRDIQRALNRLEKIRFTRSFHRKGKRGNYRVLIHKYEPQFGALKGMRLNAEKSESWESPVYEACAVADAVTDAVAVTVAAPYQEEESRSRKKTPSAPAKEPSPVGASLASLLATRILENNPNARITAAQMRKWGIEADVMMRRHNRAEAQIRELVDWCQRDSFWKTNILSMGKLREKFDQLTVKMGAGREGAIRDAEQRTENNLRAARFIQ